MGTQMQLEIFCPGIAWPTGSCEAETMKEPIKAKWKGKIASISVLC